ncbi:MAG: hypothetical protein Kow0065_04020 [Methylomicrobium sp.]
MCILKSIKPIILSLLLAMPVLTTQADDSVNHTVFITQADCLFNWGESSYSPLFAPPQAPSQTIGEYYYRYYANTNAYLGVSTINQHLYYIGQISNNALLDLGPAATWFDLSNCSVSEGSETEVRNFINAVLGLTQDTTTEISNQLMPILSAVLGNPSTCPVVSMNFDISQATDLDTFLQNLPKPAIATIDYGQGCVASLGDTFSGQAELRLYDLNINQTTGALGANLQLIVNNLTKNGALLSDGSISLSLAAQSLNLDDSNLLAGVQMQAQLDNFLVSNGMRLQGTVDMIGDNSSNLHMGIKLSSDNILHTDLKLLGIQQGDDMILSTEGPSSVNQYSVVFNALRFNSDLCESYPIGGTIIMSTGQQSWTARFDESCDGGYVLQ